MPSQHKTIYYCSPGCCRPSIVYFILVDPPSLVYRVVVYNLFLWLIIRTRNVVNIRFIDSFHISYAPTQIFDTNKLRGDLPVVEKIGVNEKCVIWHSFEYIYTYIYMGVYT